MTQLDPQKLATEVHDALLAIGIEAKVTSKLEQVAHGNGFSEPWIRMFVTFSDGSELDVHNLAIPTYWHVDSLARSILWIALHDHEVPVMTRARETESEATRVEIEVKDDRFRSRGYRITRVHHRVPLTL